MKIKKQETSQKSNHIINKCLESERHKRDDLIQKKRMAIEEETDGKIHLNRVAADRKRQLTRAEDDLDTTEGLRPNNHAAHQDDKILTRERDWSDRAQNVERAMEDQVRIRERFQERLIAEGLIENERQEADINLIEERIRTDLEAAQNSILLSAEKKAHNSTKVALVTRDHFLAVVSHDLKNPLGIISTCASLMRSDLCRGENAVGSLLEYLGIIERNAANVERMIGDLLDVERMANAELILKLERCDIGVLLRECKDLFEPVVISRSSSITVETCPEPEFADIDHDRILQVLSNLIGNALKFSPKGGSIKLSWQRMADELGISVTDDGPGIPKEKRSQIFERFSQLRTNDRRGLGLGLFISKWIVEAHKGRIWMDSESDKGSTFTFTLPINVSHR